ncbi:hypothetical protein N431DRAFT_490391 [Stipitochalara longipes BDJ]|nr:hypothetical protein N431DRAFT_490391 [Stipitochalara longipes BDJ]
MDPFSTIRLALGVAPLFSICLEYFEYFKTAQSLSADVEILLLKLDFEHERFIAWGEANGISKTLDEGQNPDLVVPSKSDLIKRSLKSIQALFEDGKKLQSDYGLRAVNDLDPKKLDSKFPSSSGMNRFRRSYTKLRNQAGSQSQPSILTKTKWAIHDKAKFVLLISDIRDLVSGLYNILPVSNKERDKIAFKDLRSLLPDIGRLKLVETASEEEYPTWSEAASLMIIASETGTIAGKGSIARWAEDLDDPEDIETETEPRQAPRSRPDELQFNLTNSLLHRMYFVCTSTCLTSSSRANCDEQSLGTMSISKDTPDLFPDIFPTGSPHGSRILGARIEETMKAGLGEQLLEMLREDAGNSQFSQLKNLALEASLPLKKVDVYCAPCACAIQSALKMCYESSTKLIAYITKVDDRISASCCPKSTMIGRLNSLLLTIQEFESAILSKEPHLMSFLLKFIDRVWIEQRMYHLETQLYTQEVYKTEHLSITELLQNLPNKTIIVLAEIGQCSWILQTRPFPWSPRMPKENEIYALEVTPPHNIWKKIFLGSFTPRNFTSRASSIRNTSTSMTDTKPSIYVRQSISRSPSQILRTDAARSPTAKRRKIWNLKEGEEPVFSETVSDRADDAIPFPINIDSDTWCSGAAPSAPVEAAGAGRVNGSTRVYAEMENGKTLEYDFP